MFSVIFDMDGTLLDTQKICIPAWDWAGERQGFDNMGSCIPYVCGCNVIGWSKYLHDNYPSLDVDRFNKEMRQYIIDNMVVRYKRGGEELLRFLKENGVKIALASGSSHESIDHHLKEAGCTDYFDVTVGGVDVENGKPAPDIFLLAAEKLGVAPETCFVIEYSANGIKAGYAAGMKCIGIPDVAPFKEDVKPLMIAELDSMLDAIELFKEYL